MATRWLIVYKLEKLLIEDKMLETGLFAFLDVFSLSTSIKLEVVFYDRGIVEYNLQDQKSTLIFERPSEKFICTWDETMYSPLSRKGENELNLDNFTRQPVFWSDWLTNNNEFIYGINKNVTVMSKRTR